MLRVPFDSSVTVAMVWLIPAFLVAWLAASEGGCASEGGAVERHVYDEAGRLTDEGVEYEALGNATKLPAVDAGRQELVSSYYVDGQVATQEQSKTLDSYVYDPAGRTMEATAEDTETKASRRIVSHYAGLGETVTWTSALCNSAKFS